MDGGAAEAARVLGVSRATLYAYVSRGYVRSQPTPGPSRDRRYSREDVERLRRRTEERREPDKAAARALQWGMPILESSIALIDGHRLYYRGHDAVVLSRSRSVAEVASLIWTGRFDTTFAADSRGAAVIEASVRQRSPVSRAAHSRRWPAASSRDPSAFDLRPAGVARTGWRILQTADKGRRAFRRQGSADRAHARPRVGRAPARFRPAARALILCADHELNVSSFTARCVASAGSNPYAVVIAGLAALEGTRHGGASARVESILQSMRRARDVRAARWRAARARRIDRRFRPSSVSGWRSACDGAPRHAPRTIRRLCELAFVSDFAHAATTALRESRTSILRWRRCRACSTAAGSAAVRSSRSAGRSAGSVTPSSNTRRGC